MEGGLIGEIPEDKLLATKSPEAQTQRSKEVLKLLAFEPVPKLVVSKILVQGSFNYPLYPYYSDIDCINQVAIDTTLAKAKSIYKTHLKKVARYLKTNKRGWLFSDFKCGLDDKGESIHWKVNEIIAGKRGKYTLDRALTQDGLCKIDVIVPYYGRYIEMSMIYYVHCNEGYLGQGPMPSVDDFKAALKESYGELTAEGNYFKAIKRAYSLARINKDYETIRLIEPLLTSNLVKLSTIRSDLATLKLIIDNGNYPTPNYVNIEFNRIKEAVATILDVPINYQAFNDKLDQIYGLLRSHKKKQVVSELDKVIEAIQDQVNKETEAYMRKHNLDKSALIGGELKGNKICMDKSEFIKEHKRLIKLLKDAGREGAEQEKELSKYLA